MANKSLPIFGCDVAFGLSQVQAGTKSVVIAAPTKDLCEKVIYFLAAESPASEFSLPTFVPKDGTWLAMGRIRNTNIEEHLQ